MKNPYQILGVSTNASQTQIKKAYREKAQELHPDKRPDDPKAEDVFKDISAAYNLLSNQDTRNQFDRDEITMTGSRRKPQSKPRQRQGPKSSAKRPFDRFFRQRATKSENPLKIKGTNVTYTLTVDFATAAKGAKKRVSMTTGKRLEVNVPPGTEDGQILRLKGQGMEGIGGGANGDAHVEIRVKPDSLFSRDGHNLKVSIPVTLQEAVMGAKIEVPTIDGPVTVTIPEGSNTGTVLRLKGKGLQKPTGKTRGDQYIELKVVLPKKTDGEFTDFVKRWGPDHTYDVGRPKSPAKQET
ncbi:MAG: DnaJ domain-containing protein [Rhodospirillaceae bacterium]|jgi:DnaJ-class molecular chaperone|nr:DnaJ domain-containing protein [Rhodospirillaceae bacterium]MBT7485625.1 DnaJ domain-containing protein [Rhodospirillales bacterium]MBT4699832.1 DnaJ domain-containing protein [Rhodospirillaceae bacterium]MBT5035710.1 DnaJ domain-containing protein [Rhodospirillaceae bacterium]MBT6218713.1 DnaJ domain-containing protein [Rhodospirillaceae bacterium]